MSKLNDAVAYNLFQFEMNRLSKITYKGYEKTLKEIGISYLGNTNHSTKLHHNGVLNMLTYGLYLASADASNINVCPKSSMCRESCLVGSGYAKIDALAGSTKVIDSRITYFLTVPMCCPFSICIALYTATVCRLPYRISSFPLTFTLTYPNPLEVPMKTTCPEVMLYTSEVETHPIRLLPDFSSA